MQLVGSLLDGLVHLFDSYVNLLVKAICNSCEDEIAEQAVDGRKCMKPAQTEVQQLGVLGNALTLAEDLLPRMAAKLFPGQQALHAGREDSRTKGGHPLVGVARIPELREWRRRLQRLVDRLRDHLCQQQILDLIYTEEGNANLSADTYFSLEGEDIYSQSEPLPSPFFQDFFIRLNKFASVAADVFVGRDRMIVLLLTRLLETLVMWLSNDQSFWEELEDDKKAPNPIGLQQFVFDMHFIIQMAFHYRSQSRKIRQVVNDVTNKGIEVFVKTGLDSNSVLSDYEWFNSASLSAFHTLSSKAGGAEPTSPTHSVSTYSVASGRSHNSP